MFILLVLLIFLALAGVTYLTYSGITHFGDRAVDMAQSSQEHIHKEAPAFFGSWLGVDRK
jgi:threonine/homoserine/homoserine lactone efflux protein